MAMHSDLETTQYGENGGSGITIVPRSPQTIRDPQYMRVSRLLTGTHTAQPSPSIYCGSVTTQNPGVAMVKGLSGWLKAPPVPTVRGANWVTVASVLAFR